MKSLRTLFLSLLFLLSTYVSFAQIQMHLGATTAVNATFVLDKGLSEDPRYNSTMTYNFAPIGVNFGVDFTKKFGLSLESILSNQGQIYELIDAGKQIAGERNIDLQYLQLPLLMRFMSGGNGGARANFNIGPQFSFLTDATESYEAKAGVNYVIPDGMTFEEIEANHQLLVPDAVLNQGPVVDGKPTYNFETDYYAEIDKKADAFKNAEFQIAASFGLDIDLSKHLYLTTQIRANYSLTEMTNEEAFDTVASGNGSDIFSQRANLLVGVQIGLHYAFGTTRSFKFKN